MKTPTNLHRISSILCVSIFLSLPVFAQWEAGFGVGYNFGSGRGTIGTNSSSGGGTGTTEGVYGSWGQGLNINGGVSAAICPHVGVGVDLNYNHGRQFKLNDNFTTPIYTQTEMYTGSVNGLRVNPYVQLHGGDKCHVDPYARFGPQINLLGTMKQEEETSTTQGGVTTTSEEKLKITGGLNLGWEAAFGGRYKLNDQLDLYGEFSVSSSCFRPKKYKMISYTENGVDKLDNVPMNQREGTYVKELTSPPSGGANEPGQQLMDPAPYSSFGISVGVKYNLGGKPFIAGGLQYENTPPPAENIANDCHCATLELEKVRRNVMPKVSVRDSIKTGTGGSYYKVEMKGKATIACDNKGAEGACTGTVYITGKCGAVSSSRSYTLSTPCATTSTYDISHFALSPSLTADALAKKSYTVTFTIEVVCAGKMKRNVYTSEVGNGMGIVSPSWGGWNDVPDAERRTIEEDYKKTSIPNENLAPGESR